MKKLNYFISLLFVGVLTLSFTACGGDDDVETVDNGVYGKFETLTINDVPFYNCVEAPAALFSFYEHEPDYITWENGQYVKKPAYKIDLKMYDKPTIEAHGLAKIYLTLEEASFDDAMLSSNGGNVTKYLLDLSVEILSDTKYGYGADYREQIKVLEGGIVLKKKKENVYTVTFNNFKVDIKGDVVSINGTATFEKQH
ncbi:MAG: hypothetical protein KBT34_04135 [Prevotella sp.]|nr:hypothetical protein [Candidatus Prevotella equi]